MFAYRRALARGGRYRCVGGSVRALLRVVTVGWLAGRLTGRRLGVLLVRPGPPHFEPLADLCLAGEIDIHIDRTFALDDVAAALAHVGEGRALGKVVVAPGLSAGRTSGSTGTRIGVLDHSPRGEVAPRGRTAGQPRRDHDRAGRCDERGRAEARRARAHRGG